MGHVFEGDTPAYTNLWRSCADVCLVSRESTARNVPMSTV